MTTRLLALIKQCLSYSIAVGLKVYLEMHGVPAPPILAKFANWRKP
jgi:hypothetical protein